MREAEIQVQVLALQRGLEADALDFELFLEAFMGALHEIGEQRARKAVQRLVLARVALFFHQQGLAVEPRFDAGGQRVLELAARPLDVHEGPVNGDFHLVGNRNGFLADARHMFLPYA